MLVPIVCWSLSYSEDMLSCSHNPFKIRKDGYADDQDCDADDDTDDREGYADKNADDDVRKGSKRVATS